MIKIVNEDSFDDYSPETAKAVRYRRAIDKAIKDISRMEKNGEDYDLFEICDSIADKYNIDINKVKSDINKKYNVTESIATEDEDKYYDEFI